MELAGRYRLLTMLGRGGMGEVWLGQDAVLRRKVAVKVLPSMAGTESVRRFEQEAANLAKLQHPGITVVHDAGRHEGHLFIVMELLRGEDLARLMAGHRDGLPLDRVLGLARQTVDALAAGHQHKVIHRDLKPANIFVQTGDHVKICDFGIARSADASEALTSTGLVLGTPAYISPEQWQAQPIDTRADLYALGAVIFELLTGRPPFSANQSPYALMRQHVEEVPPRPGTLRPDVPGWLEDLVMGLLAKNPDDRPDHHALTGAFGDGAAGPRSGEPADAPPALEPADAPPASQPYGALGGDEPDDPRLTLMSEGGSHVASVAFSPDGHTLAADAEGGVVVWDAHTGAQLRLLTVRRIGKVRSVAFSPDGRLLATGSDNKVVRIWDPDTGEQLRELTGHSAWTTRVTVAFSPDGRLLASSGSDNMVRIWDTQTGVQRRQLKTGQQLARPLAFSPDGETLAANGGVGEVSLWNPRTGQLQRTLAGHQSETKSVAFSPDGSLLATSCGKNNEVRVWRGGVRLHVLTGHRGWLASVQVAFGPDGRTLATVGDKVVRIWDPETGEQVRELTGHSGRVRCLAFSPDGHTLATGDSNGVVHLWAIQA
jgi:Tol biopolymer transport system component/tRNA A-37 threonylcarbamoyl transferase component Bud32